VLEIAGQSKVSAEQFNAIADAMPPTGRLLEVGTFHGATAAMLADMFPSATIISIDNFSGATAENYIKNRRPNMHLIIGTAGHLAKSGYTAKFDVIFIDAMHKYPDCLDDLRNTAPLLVPGGVIFAHDYDKKRYPGVVQSIDEFCAESGFSIVNLTDTDSSLVEMRHP